MLVLFDLLINRSSNCCEIISVRREIDVPEKRKAEMCPA